MTARSRHGIEQETKCKTIVELDCEAQIVSSKRELEHKIQGQEFPTWENLGGVDALLGPGLAKLVASPSLEELPLNPCLPGPTCSMQVFLPTCRSI